MSGQTCAWTGLLNDHSRANLEVGFVITGAVSALLAAWLNLSLLTSYLQSDLSYRNLAIFTVVACMRRAMSIFSHLPLLNYSESSFYVDSCDYYGFWETFFGVLEVECLTHVCIERYVVAKYIARGWPIPKNYYILYPSLCVLFAFVYSSPPLFGLGKYALDFSCQSCVLDMVLPVTWHKYVVLTIFLLRSVKSTGFMITMLIWARNIEARYDNSGKLQNEKRFTESVIVITIVNFLCWMPITLIRGWVVLSYLLSNEVQVRPSASAVLWAIWVHWASPAFTTVAMFLTDDKVYKKMLNICKSEEIIEETNKEE